MTNQRVVNTDAVKGQGPTDEADMLNVTIANGKTYKAQVIGRSLSYDIAVLQVFAPLESLKPLPLGKSTSFSGRSDHLRHRQSLRPGPYADQRHRLGLEP